MFQGDRSPVRDLRILVGDSREVGVEVAVSVLGRQIERTMRVEQVDPGKERVGIVTSEPGHGLLDHRICAAAGHSAGAAHGPGVAVQIESLFEAAIRRKDCRRDERGRS